VTETTTDVTIEQIQEVHGALDPEAAAIQTIATALRLLDADACNRVIGYATSRWYTNTDTDDGPRAYWLDELPAEGDVLCHSGRDLPVTGVRVQAAGERVEYWLTTACADVSDESSQRVHFAGNEEEIQP
jgi:hypothetical protein